MRILIIGEKDDCSRMLQVVLKRSSHTTQHAIGWSDGIQQASSLEPELVLLDIDLLGIDGYRVAQALREDVGLNEATIVAVSRHIVDYERCKASGIDAHLPKPAEIGAVLRLIDCKQKSSLAETVNQIALQGTLK